MWHIVEPDGTRREPARCTTVDGRFSWSREAGESADAFEQRMTADAEKLLALHDDAPVLAGSPEHAAAIAKGRPVLVLMPEPGPEPRFCEGQS
jgi:hypothetical protein